MEVQASSGGRPALRALLRYLMAGSFVTLGLFCLVVFLHALTSAPYLVAPIYALGGLMTALAGGSMVLGVYYAWARYPQHRRVVVFLVAITLGTLLAHAYIVGAPSVAASSSVTGDPSKGFNDAQLTVNGGVTGNQLQLTVTDSGSNAVSALNVSVEGSLLTEGGFPIPPNYTNPMEPQQSMTGTWTLPPGASASSVTVGYHDLTCYSPKDRDYGCIMDEIYYVPEGMAILNGYQCSTGGGAPSYCHLEHPFLAPALIASGMAVFGQYSTAGWRLMPALLGSFSIPLVFGISWKLSGEKKIAYLAAVFLSLDVMFFSQSSGALLDIPEVFFALAGFFAYFSGLKWWKFDRYVVAGVLLGAAGLAKETAVFLVLALLTYMLFFGEGDRWPRLYHILKVTIVVGIVFAVGLQAYDSTLAKAVPTFIQDVSYILSYGSTLIAKELACSPTTGYWCKYANSPGGAPILPTDWLVYYNPVAYYLVTISTGTYSYIGIGYYGITNLLISWTTWVWVPLIAWSLYAYRRSGAAPHLEGPVEAQAEAPAATTPASPEPSPPPADMEERSRPPIPDHLRFAGFTLIFFLWSYVPYLFLLAAGRVTYPFYIIPAIPAISMGAAYWTAKTWFPKWLLAAYILAAFIFFLSYFPDKAFLPIWLRVILRH